MMERRHRRDSAAACTAVAVLVSVCFCGLDVALHAQVDKSPVKPDVTERSDSDNRPPEPDVEASIRRAFTELADSDASVREAARTTLMSVERPHLPLLEKVVAESRPLLPSQAAVLRQIVTHVFLAGDLYPANGNFGWLGVRMSTFSRSVEGFPGAGVLPAPRLLPEGRPALPGGDDPPEEPAPPPHKRGVMIVHRFAGFVGNLVLRDGDIIVGLADHPDVDVDDAFIEAVKATGAGRTIRFIVLRYGRLIRVSARLDPKPDIVIDRFGASIEQLERDRNDKVKAYWRKTFRPLLEDRQVG